ncbi:MAG TPA: hypothetical protein VJG85_00830, partial [Patescibacteria group bacterium]|nr:hypothetical protein [Patescibacteria group bacterium]
MLVFANPHNSLFSSLQAFVCGFGRGEAIIFIRNNHISYGKEKGKMNKGRSDFLSFLITREALYILGWALLSMVVAYGLSTQTNDVLELVKESLMFAALFAVVAGFFYWRSSKTTTSKKTAADTKV